MVVVDLWFWLVRKRSWRWWSFKADSGESDGHGRVIAERW